MPRSRGTAWLAGTAIVVVTLAWWLGGGGPVQQIGDADQSLRERAERPHRLAAARPVLDAFIASVSTGAAEAAHALATSELQQAMTPAELLERARVLLIGRHDFTTCTTRTGEVIVSLWHRSRDTSSNVLVVETPAGWRVASLYRPRGLLKDAAGPAALVRAMAMMGDPEVSCDALHRP